jgi:hypothetical protein
MSENCCIKPKNNKGLLSGLLYGLLPHTFCIAFVVFSVIGAVSLTAIFKKILLVPYFFQILVVLSFAMATISAVIYLKRNSCLCGSGIKKKWKYLTILYGLTIFVNIFMFSYVFPALANVTAGNIDVSGQQLESLSFSVAIPCSGHAPLIIDELKKDSGVKNVNFKMPNIFNIQYNPKETSVSKIESIDIFETYKLKVVN